MFALSCNRIHDYQQSLTRNIALFYPDNFITFTILHSLHWQLQRMFSRSIFLLSLLSGKVFVGPGLPLQIKSLELPPPTPNRMREHPWKHYLPSNYVRGQYKIQSVHISESHEGEAHNTQQSPTESPEDRWQRWQNLSFCENKKDLYMKQNSILVASSFTVADHVLDETCGHLGSIVIFNFEPRTESINKFKWILCSWVSLALVGWM